MAKGIYKRGKVYWIRYAGLDGKTVFESAGSKKFKDAEELYIKRKKAIKDGKQPAVKKIQNHTFKELAGKYSQWMQGRHKSADSKKYRIDQLLVCFGSLPLRNFNTELVEQHQTDLINKNLKPATVNRNLSVLKAMIRKAVDWNMVEEEILKQVRRVKNLPENNERLRFLSKDECKRLISACEERNRNDKRVKHLKPILITALNTGMRKSEILNLKWDNVDLKHGFILLDRTKNGDRREIPINETLKINLESLPRHINSDYVFCEQKKGNRYGNIKRSFATVCTRAKLLDFHFHDMRHTFASHLVMAGVDITTVSRLLGHKDIKMTLRYSHLAPAHMRNAVDKLNSALFDNHGSIQKVDNLADEKLTAKEKSFKINAAPLAQVDRAQVS